MQKLSKSVKVGRSLLTGFYGPRLGLSVLQICFKYLPIRNQVRGVQFPLCWECTEWSLYAAYLSHVTGNVSKSLYRQCYR